MKKSVWVIDDDDIYQLIIKKLIKRSDLFEKQHYFKSAAQVIKDLEDSKLEIPDLILLDINMPQLDGWQFIEKLRTFEKSLLSKTAIYIVSSSIAYSDKERAERYEEILGFLSKPVTVKDLKRIVEELNKKSPA